jgi:hypothetical protein
MKGYSSMPNDPLGRYKGVLSLAQLERARRCALQNAEELVSDAELLVITLEEMRAGWGPAIRDASETPNRMAYASLKTPGGHIQLNDILIEIVGLTYSMPINTYLEEVTITARGEFSLVIRDEHGALDKAITAEDLRRVGFTESGEAILKGR